MSPIPEAKTGAPNIQDVFLNYARREKLPVTIHLLDGREFEARIKPRTRIPIAVVNEPVVPVVALGGAPLGVGGGA